MDIFDEKKIADEVFARVKAREHLREAAKAERSARALTERLAHIEVSPTPRKRTETAADRQKAASIASRFNLNRIRT